jgi:hypothetical protein
MVAFGAAAARRRLFRPLIGCQVDRVRRGTSPLDDLSQAAHDLDRRAFSRSATSTKCSASCRTPLTRDPAGPNGRAADRGNASSPEPGPSSPPTRRWRKQASNPRSRVTQPRPQDHLVSPLPDFPPARNSRRKMRTDTGEDAPVSPAGQRVRIRLPPPV